MWEYEHPMLGSLGPRGCLVVLASYACSRAALAERAPACELVVRTGPLAAPWVRAIEALRAELAVRPDIDHCADLRVAPAAEGATIEVTSGGRLAARVVETPADLRAAIIALLVIPPSSRPSAPPPRAAVELPALPSGLPSSIGPGVAVERADAPETPETPETPIRSTKPNGPAALLDLRMAGGAAWSGSRVGAAITASASRERAGWIVSATGRWERGQRETGDRPAVSLSRTLAPPDEDSVQAIGIGIELGRELQLGPVAVALSSARRTPTSHSA